MWLLLVGVVGLVMKYFEIEPVAQLDWWWLLVPFALTALWWWYADQSGYTRRKVIEQEQARKQERIERQRSQLGMLSSRSNRRKRLR